MRATGRSGVTLQDIREEIGCSHRTAQRWTAALEEAFPQTVMEDGDDRQRRWNVPARYVAPLLTPSGDEFAALGAAIAELDNRGLAEQARLLRDLRAKMRTLSPVSGRARNEVDEEIMLQALGHATRPGPKPAVIAEVEAALIEAFRSQHDFHAETAARVFGVAAAEVSPEQRAKIKAMNYGLAYGLSAYGLSGQLRISTEEAKGLMDDYFAGFGGVRDYLAGVVDQARKDGYTATILGRRRYLPDLTSDNRQRREMAERMALNAPIQGSAADIIKVAMLGVYRALQAEGLRSRMLLQVHDELVLEVAAGEREQLEQLVREHMGAAADLLVPLDVSVGTGRSWHEAAH